MEATHAIYWLPARGWSDGHPYWGLTTAAEFEQRIIVGGRIPRCTLPRDADLNPLAQWVSNCVGYQVVLVRDEQRIRRLDSSEWETVPFCWAYPDGGEAPPAVQAAEVPEGVA